MPAPNVVVSLVIGSVLVGIGTPVAISVGLAVLVFGAGVQIALSYTNSRGSSSGNEDTGSPVPSRAVAPYKVPQGEDISEY